MVKRINKFSDGYHNQDAIRAHMAQIAARQGELGSG